MGLAGESHVLVPPSSVVWSARTAASSFSGFVSEGRRSVMGIFGGGDSTRRANGSFTGGGEMADSRTNDVRGDLTALIGEGSVGSMRESMLSMAMLMHTHLAVELLWEEMLL